MSQHLGMLDIRNSAQVILSRTVVAKSLTSPRRMDVHILVSEPVISVMECLLFGTQYALVISFFFLLRERGFPCVIVLAVLEN